MKYLEKYNERGANISVGVHSEERSARVRRLFPRVSVMDEALSLLVNLANLVNGRADSTSQTTLYEQKAINGKIGLDGQVD